MVLVESFSGIRGTYGTELTDEIAEIYSAALTDFLKKKQKKKEITIVIGRDTRKSGPSLKNALIKGCNCNIIDVDILPTAAVEHAVRHFHADGGIIITASHNEPEFNGFKFLDYDGAVLRPSDIEEVICNFNIKNKDKNKTALAEKNIKRNQTTIKYLHDKALNSYCDFITFNFTDEEKNKLKSQIVKIVVDSNGGTGHISKKIFERIGLNAVYLNNKEGDFVRKIEPTSDSLKYLVQHITENNAEFAAGFDCDADRVEIILKNGHLVSGNHLLALILKYILSDTNLNVDKKNPDSVIVVNDATSYLVKEIAEQYGASIKEVEVGEINVADAMLKEKSPLGGEGSNGGVIIPPSMCRDGILTIVYLLKLMIKEHKSLSELIDGLPKYYYLKEKIKLKNEFYLSREKIKEYYTENKFSILETGDSTGGLKAISEKGWIWFRQSKTEDKVLRIIADSKNMKDAELLLKEAMNLLE